MFCTHDFTASTIDISGTVMGGNALDWSENGLLSIATNGYSLVSEFEDMISSDYIPIKTELVRWQTKKENFKELFKYIDKDKARNDIPKKGPDINSFKFKIKYCPKKNEGGELKTAGIKSVWFSPLHFSIKNPIIAMLNQYNGLSLFVLNEKYMTWTEVVDLSTNFQRNNIYQDLVSKISTNSYDDLTNLCNMYSFTCICWPKLEQNQENDRILFAASNTTGVICIWTINLPILSDKQLELSECIDMKTNSEAKALIACGESKSSKDAKLCVGFSNGKILYVDSGKVTHLWEDEDYLSVSSIVFQQENNDEVTIACAKSSVLLFVRILNGKPIAQCTKNSEFVTTLKTVLAMKGKGFMALSENGGLALCQVKIEMEEMQVTWETIRAEEYHPTIPITYNQACLSPNHAFIACLTSFQRISSNTQIPNNSCVTLKPCISPEEVCKLLKRYQILGYKEDIIQLLWCYLANKAIPKSFYCHFSKPPTYNTVNLEWYWYFYKFKAESSIETNLPNTTDIQHIEKIITARQMVTVLKAAVKKPQSFKTVPVRGITSWLFQNISLLNVDLNGETLTLLNNVKNNNKFGPDNICEYSGTKFTFSEDGLSADTVENTTWPRCCLTFIPIQFKKTYRCKYSKKFCLRTNQDFPKEINDLLLSAKCPYTLFDML